ncbi:MAG: serine/threonine protein kinase, partial [Deltaproteobacteria bacterium]|nr:serine/threonine protein kinase [Deltaproteobacteria bacterium]
MSQDPRIGAVLQDRYRIVSRVAEGAMGVIYRGERIGLERAVAIKFLHESVVANPESRRRFETEAKAASRLGHPNCVAVIDFGIDHDAPYLVMDYVFGRTLRDLQHEEPVTVGRALDLGRQILAGLAHAHGHGIIHRDVKPENVLVTADGTTEHARILDFGLAKLKDAATITDGVAVGTPSYMSPEQTLGERADARSDVYGAGVVIYELLTGVKPFSSKSPFEVMRMHRDVPVPSFASSAPDRAIAADLEAVVLKSLAKDPDARFPTAVQFASALERTLR